MAHERETTVSAVAGASAGPLRGTGAPRALASEIVGASSTPRDLVSSRDLYARVSSPAVPHPVTSVLRGGLRL